jgi:hypothetical protein
MVVAAAKAYFEIMPESPERGALIAEFKALDIRALADKLYQYFVPTSEEAPK